MRRADNDRGYSLLETTVVLAIGLVLMMVSIQALRSAAGAARVQGDALTVSRHLYMAKLRAGSDFTRSRLSIDTVANTYAVEILDRATSTWVADVGPVLLGPGVAFGSGAVATPLPGLPDLTPQHPIIFNSRGMPVDSTGVPTGLYAVYLTDGSRVFAIRVSLGGRPTTLEFRGGAWSEI